MRLPKCVVCMDEITDDFCYQAESGYVSFRVCKDCMKHDWSDFTDDLKEYMEEISSNYALGEAFQKFMVKVLDSLDKPDRVSSKLERFMADYEVDNEEVLERWLTFR